MKSLDIIFENESFVAVNKPAGLLSIPDREGKELSLKSMLTDKYGSIFTVHRLDRGTSGVIVFAKDEDTHRFLSLAFEERNVEKYYTGFAKGNPTPNSGTIEAPIAEHSSKRGVMLIHKRGKASITDYEVLEGFGKFSYLQFRIHTGRTHQIRVHMQSIGHPLLCDELYGDPSPIFLSSIKKKFNLSKDELEERPILNRLALHSQKLVFTDQNNQRISLEAEPPKDLRAFLQQLRKNL